MLRRNLLWKLLLRNMNSRHKREVKGTIDEGERNTAIVEQMKEDAEVVLVDNYLDDFNEEGDQIPVGWR
jgi:hypothetical protein